MSEVLTAADYAYSDTMDLLYMEVKETIANWIDHLDWPEIEAEEPKRRIPGSLKDLNERVQTMLKLGVPAESVVHLIELKVREAHKLPPA